MLSKNRLKAKLIAAFNEQAEEDDADAAIDRICDKMAQAMVEEILELKITYYFNLAVPNVGVVVGNINNILS
jgi:hypothetical protein